MRQRLRSNGLIEAALAVKKPQIRGLTRQGRPDKVKAFVDTNILIYAYDVDAFNKHEIAKGILR